ncbi:MAG TPA: hypothetical protein VK139_04450, partial [Microbacteriaceae bacterium]|nr:hypothetical protein [Microbacteriaceae bacterium]
TPSSIPAGDDAPEPDVEIIEVVENLFTSEPARAELDPTHVPTEPGLENGPLHWTEALALPANLDPTDPASMPHLPALVSDTNTIVLDDIPGAGALTQVTGEIDLVVTGSILLPTSLTETGALDHLIDSDESSDRDDDIADEMPLSHLAPKSASAAVNANSSAPAMVSEPVRQRMGVPMIVALAAGGATGIVLIALGLGALLHLF